jgi:PEP-CTERM motif-containing protein
MRIWLSGFLFAALLLAESAFATTINYTSSAAFLSALSGEMVVIETYETQALNSLIPSGSTVDGITYNSFPAATSGRIDNLFNRIGNQSLALERGGVASFFFPGDSMTVTFPHSVNAVGIFFNVAQSPVGSLGINTAVGTATNGPTYDISTFYFVGLISDTSFTSATIFGNSNIASGFNVDNLTYASPEPSTLLLLGFGLVGVAVWVRRRTA